MMLIFKKLEEEVVEYKADKSNVKMTKMLMKRTKSNDSSSKKNNNMYE